MDSANAKIFAQRELRIFSCRPRDRLAREAGLPTITMKNNGLTREESIRLEAYLLSEKAGHPTGMEQFFWMQAEALVQKRSTTAMPVAKRAAAAPKSRTRTRQVVEQQVTKPALPAAPPSKKKSTKTAIAAVATAEPAPTPMVAAKRRMPAKKSRALPVGK